MKNALKRIRRARPSSPEQKTHLIRFADPAGPELTVAMAAGDALAFGGVRVDITPDGRIDVTPWTPAADEDSSSNA